MKALTALLLLAASATLALGGRDGHPNGRRLQSPWPHSLTLTITFDARPEEVSWKFENRRSGAVLAGRAFGDYAPSRASTTLAVPLDILTEQDLEGDPLGGPREYRLVVFDRGGNGLCCGRGRGRFELRDGDRVVFEGDEYGASVDSVFSVDPDDYLNPKQSQDDLPAFDTGSGVPPQQNPPADSQSDQEGDGGKPSSSSSLEPPTLMLSFFCGLSYGDAETECHEPCPTGSPSSCTASEHSCYASTTCRERWETGTPTERPVATERPTSRPTREPSGRPTREAPSFSIAITGPGSDPSPTPRPVPTMAEPAPTTGGGGADDGPTSDIPGTSPTESIINDHDSWFCGLTWDWTISNCEKAVPCPGGDAVDCPPNHACFASTPCTLVPTSLPSESPSGSPSESPTGVPTRAPWSRDFFVDFLYGDADTDTTTTGGGNDPADLSAPDVNDALASYGELQYHFFCGSSWTSADSRCDTFCPSGDRSDCPDGMECYANTRCDGRDTASPTSSPGPTVYSANPNACTICGTRALDADKGITFQTQETTCGNMNEQLAAQDIEKSSGTCGTIREMYADDCCYDECSLCEQADGTTLDLRSNHVVRQGGYEATCLEVTEMLRAAGGGDLCGDARDQLAEQCCRSQCELCSGLEGASPQWYETVVFNGLTTTCLGLDYMLRVEEVGEGGEMCDNFRNEYGGACCYPPSSDASSSGEGGTAAAECRLCEADGRLYDVIPEKAVDQTAGTCGGVDEELRGLPKEDGTCTESRQRYFGRCCNLADYVLVAPPVPSPAGLGGGSGPPGPSPAGGNATSGGVGENATAGGAPSNATSPSGAGYWDRTPVDEFDWKDTWEVPSSGYKARTAAVFGWTAACLVLRAWSWR